MKKKTAILWLVGLFLLAACASEAAPPEDTTPAETVSAGEPAAPTEAPAEASDAPAGEMRLFSPSFENEGVIPLEYGMPPFNVTYGERNFVCSGKDAEKENISPAMMWENVPAEAESLLLVMVDMMSYAHDQLPDAAAFPHWLVYNIPPETSGFPETKGGELALPEGAAEGMNGYPEEFSHGYGGPCPPPNEEHQYLFTLYALDTVLDAEPEIWKEGLLDLSAIEPHVIAEASWVGYYTNQ